MSASDADTVRRRSVRAVFGRLLENGAIPKLIILTVVLCSVYLLLRLSVDLLDVHRLSLFGVFSVYVDTVSALVNATNYDIISTAATYNSVLMPSFADVIHSQLIDLHQLIDHFNNRLYRLISSNIVTRPLIVAWESAMQQWGHSVKCRGCHVNSSVLSLLLSQKSFS